MELRRWLHSRLGRVRSKPQGRLAGRRFRLPEGLALVFVERIETEELKDTTDPSGPNVTSPVGFAGLI